MSGKGELVEYTKIFVEGPLTPKKKKDLKDDIGTIIDFQSGDITIMIMAEPSVAAAFLTKGSGGKKGKT
ncbi:MAG TPA: hypothetical protein VKF40_05520 [Burkholderiales bacterium]|nr:hypothetical protein [Burkholderiales bacterium]